MSVTVAAAIERFLGDLQQASPHTQRGYRLDLCCFQRHLVREMGPSPLLAAIDRRQIRSYLAVLHQRGYKRRTVRRRVAVLRSWCRFCLRHQLLATNPIADIGHPQLQKMLPLVLTTAQIEHLFAQPDTRDYLGLRDRCLLELGYGSGLRVSELVGLDRQQLQPRSICVYGKGKRERAVPITARSADWLQRYLGHHQRHLHTKRHFAEQDRAAIFLNKWGQRLTARGVERVLAKYWRRSGLAGHATPHTLRHSIATHWLEQGMPLKMIQTLLGHQELTTTTLYTQVSSVLKQRTYQQSHPLAKDKKRESNKPDSVGQ